MAASAWASALGHFLSSGPAGDADDSGRAPIEALMSVDSHADNLTSTVRYALETTRATAVCPFHADVTIRVGDDAAENHAYLRAKNAANTNGMTCRREALLEEFKRQLSDAADGHCPQCARIEKLHRKAI
jgi:hypothetical protein